ncbi:MAG TPA: hypothetical protein PLV58_02405 [Campylobacterales bacterium]|nr:hypothetical protein [Campylobacterales bacterium]
MELKDAILSTLAEIEDIYIEESREQREVKEPKEIKEVKEIKEELKEAKEIKEVPQKNEQNAAVMEAIKIDENDESIFYTNENMDRFLLNLRERVLVLFEGLLTLQQAQSSDAVQVEKKLDLTINFLEYLLATIEEKLDKSQE